MNKTNPLTVTHYGPGPLPQGRHPLLGPDPAEVAQARIAELETENKRLSAALGIIKARSETADIDHPGLGLRDFDGGFRAGLRDAAYYARSALSPSTPEGDAP